MRGEGGQWGSVSLVCENGILLIRVQGYRGKTANSQKKATIQRVVF